jgi:uncharacterized membrane protein (GlpM family)
VAGQNIALKAAVTPLLIGGASRAGRRFGHHVCGWLVGLPYTSGPVAFFLATEQGERFAAATAVGMLAGTASQVAFALAYGRVARAGAARAFFVGSAAFAAATTMLAGLDWSALATFALVLAVLAVGRAVSARRELGPAPVPTPPPRWDMPVRMLAATLVVVLITALAPVLGPHLAGLLAPFPVFGAVLALFTHYTHGPVGAVQSLDGLVLGLFAPAVFFLVLAVMLPSVGLVAFAIAAACAITTHVVAMLAIPRGEGPAVP